MSADVATWTPPGHSVDQSVRLEVEDFLFAEAELVDSRRFDEWLELFADDLEYRAPARVWRANAHQQVDALACYWDDTKPTLGARIQRLGTGAAWTEMPPSVIRHFITNVRVHHGEIADELWVRCNLLVTRNRGPAQAQDMFPADRFDVLRRAEDSFKIRRRTVVIDAVTPNAQNLAIFF